MVGDWVKAIDSNLLVYASLADHPAATACEGYIASHTTWTTNVVNLLELRRVLVAVYGVSDSDADAKLIEFLQALMVENLTPSIARAAISLRRSHKIDFNDAVLLETCRERGATALATDDAKLAGACAAIGIRVENPVTPALRAEMASWEHQNLPAKGLPRILLRVHRWIEQYDPTLAGDFHSATQALSRLV